MCSVKCRQISHNHHIIPNCQDLVAEGKVDTLGKAGQLQIDRCPANILKLNKLRVRIADWVVHDFGNPKALRHRANTKRSIIQRGPLGTVESPGFYHCCLVQDNRVARQRLFSCS